MKNIVKQFYKVRVVVDHRFGDYEVQTKAHWYSSWRRYSWFDSLDCTNPDDLKELAIQCADRLASNRIIYEVKCS